MMPRNNGGKRNNLRSKPRRWGWAEKIGERRVKGASHVPPILHECLKKEYPGLLPSEIEEILGITTVVHNPDISIKNQAKLALRSWLRHVHTDYNLLVRIFPKHEARRRVMPKVSLLEQDLREGKRLKDS